MNPVAIWRVQEDCLATIENANPLAVRSHLSTIATIGVLIVTTIEFT